MPGVECEVSQRFFDLAGLCLYSSERGRLSPPKAVPRHCHSHGVRSGGSYTLRAVSAKYTSSHRVSWYTSPSN